MPRTRSTAPSTAPAISRPITRRWPTQPDTPEAPDARRWTDRLTGRLVGNIRVLHQAEKRGDLAALRRLDHRRPMEPVFHRLLVRVEPDGTSRERMRRLALLARILALPRGVDALSQGFRPLGRAMDEAEISESRVQVLMTARGAGLEDAILRLSRRLAQAGPIPFFEIGRLLLGGEEEVEETRYRVARDYWTANAVRERGEATPPTTGDIE